MKAILAPMLLTLLAMPVAAQSPASPISLEHRMLLRCSAAFAMVAHDQGAGKGAAYPPLATSGREFFVRASVRVMDEANLSREQIAAALAAEAQDIRDGNTLDQVMPVCLPMLVIPGE